MNPASLAPWWRSHPVARKWTMRVGCLLEVAVLAAIYAHTMLTVVRPGYPSSFELVDEGSLTDLEAELARGLDPNEANVNGTTILDWAARGTDPTKVQVLLEHGANPNARNADGYTPLHFAAQSGRAVTCRILIRHGADGAARESHGYTAMDLAQRRGDKCILRALSLER